MQLLSWVLRSGIGRRGRFCKLERRLAGEIWLLGLVEDACVFDRFTSLLKSIWYLARKPAD